MLTTVYISKKERSSILSVKRFFPIIIERIEDRENIYDILIKLDNRCYEMYESIIRFSNSVQDRSYMIETFDSVLERIKNRLDETLFEYLVSVLGQLHAICLNQEIRFPEGIEPTDDLKSIVSNSVSLIRELYEDFIDCSLRCQNREVLHEAFHSFIDVMRRTNFNNYSEYYGYCEYLIRSISNSSTVVSEIYNIDNHNVFNNNISIDGSASYLMQDNNCEHGLHLYPMPRIQYDDKTSIKILANKADKRSKLIAPIGIEFTYHFPWKKKKEQKNISSNSIFNVGALIDAIHVTNVTITQGSIQDGRACTDLNQQYIPVQDIPYQSEPYQGEQDQSEQDQQNNPAPLDNSTNIIIPNQSSSCDDVKLIRILRKENLLKDYGAKGYIGGPDIAEICSPVFKSYHSLFKWFKSVHAIALKNRYTTYKLKEGGGGIHLNISYNKELVNWKLAYSNFFIMIANYPEINWIFNEASDNHTSKCLILENRFSLALFDYTKHKNIDDLWTDLSVCGGKGYAINCKDNQHFELRTFRMVKNHSELKDIIDFANGLLKLCAEIAKWNILIPLELEVPTKYSEKAEERGFALAGDIYNDVFLSKMWSAEEDFKELLKWLNLDYNRYKKYIKRNLHKRRAHPYGKFYMN